MIAPLRRVVTGRDPQGRSTVLSDGPAETMIWRTEVSPAGNSGSDDAGGGPFGFDIPEGGSLFIFGDLPPDGTLGDMGMHATDTIDYVTVISGQVTLVTETAETLLRAGDVLVQRGVVHGWRNDGPDPCRLAVVLLKAHPIGRDPAI